MSARGSVAARRPLLQPAVTEAPPAFGVFPYRAKVVGGRILVVEDATGIVQVGPLLEYEATRLAVAWNAWSRWRASLSYDTPGATGARFSLA